MSYQSCLSLQTLMQLAKKIYKGFNTYKHRMQFLLKSYIRNLLSSNWTQISHYAFFCGFDTSNDHSTKMHFQMIV
jgi:hypothetical protein